MTKLDIAHLAEVAAPEVDPASMEARIADIAAKMAVAEHKEIAERLEVLRLKFENERLLDRLREAEEALRDVENPMRVLQRKADAEGGTLNGYAHILANDVHFIRKIASSYFTQHLPGGEP